VTCMGAANAPREVSQDMILGCDYRKSQDRSVPMFDEFATGPDYVSGDLMMILVAPGAGAVEASRAYEMGLEPGTGLARA